MNWIKVEIHNPKECRHALINNLTIEKVVDNGEYRTIVFDFASMRSGDEIFIRYVDVADSLDDLQRMLNG
jgi:hypothetical protein